LKQFLNQRKGGEMKSRVTSVAQRQWHIRNRVMANYEMRQVRTCIAVHTFHHKTC
jgi:hypothetical protein